MCKKMSNFSDEVRCGIALTVPKILTAIASDSKKDLPTHLLPSYTIHIYTADHEICGMTHPFFVPEVLADRGKKRVYSNGTDGVKITYAYRHDINKLMHSMLQSEIVDKSVAVKLTELMSERWIITKGYPKFKNWDAFVGQLVAIQEESTKSNKPYTGTENYLTMIDVINECPDIPYRPHSVRCLHHGYVRISLSKYEI